MISVVCPTRGRPENVRRMWESATATATGDIEACFYLDDDDPVGSAQFDDLPGTVNFVVAPRCLLATAWNEAAKLAHGDILMPAGDDLIFRTVGWDKAVADAMPADGIGFVYGRDGYQDENLGTHGFITTRWVKAVGYFLPPYFAADYTDLWLHEVAGMIGRRIYLPDVLIEHMHPVCGKGEWDQTHHERLARHAEQDPGTLYASLIDARRSDAEHLRFVMR